MTPGARVAAAIEVVEEIEARKRPAADALKDWGLSHRFAGSGDRAAIASLVFDAQRKRASRLAPGAGYERRRAGGALFGPGARATPAQCRRGGTAFGRRPDRGAK